MECIAPLRSRTTSPNCLTTSTASLAAAFATVPDPRRQASVIYPLPAILSLAVAAILCAHDSVLAIAQWGSQQDRALVQRLGFPGVAPVRWRD
jgi:DDE family transposase